MPGKPQTSSMCATYGHADCLSHSPGKLLRSFPPLQAKQIIAGTVNMVRKIPADLYEELVHHAE